MLSKSNRLTSTNDFQKVYRKGETFFTKHLILRKYPNNKQSTRFGVVVSQKISKKATVRNKIKRQIRELIRLKLADIIKGFDCVIIPKRSFMVANIRQLNRDFEEMLNKSDILI